MIHLERKIVYRNHGATAMTREIYTEEQDIFRDAFRKFLEKEAVPHQEEWIKAGIVPRETWKKTGEQGFIAPWLPNVVRVGWPIFDLTHLLLLLPNAEGQVRCKASPSPGVRVISLTGR